MRLHYTEKLAKFEFWDGTLVGELQMPRPEYLTNWATRDPINPPNNLLSGVSAVNVHVAFWWQSKFLDLVSK